MTGPLRNSEFCFPRDQSLSVKCETNFPDLSVFIIERIQNFRVTNLSERPLYRPGSDRLRQKNGVCALVNVHEMAKIRKVLCKQYVSTEKVLKSPNILWLFYEL